MENREDAAALSPVTRFLSFISSKPYLFTVCVFFLGLILRILFLPNPGFEADISFWKSWGLAQFDHGIVWSIENTNNNYPTAFAYVLGMMTRVYSLFADPHNFDVYWNNQNLLFLTISKMPSVLADFGIAALILYFGKLAQKKNKNPGFPAMPMALYAVLAALYLLNPLAILDGAWWGQVDSLGVFIYLVAFLLVVLNKPYLAGFVYMAAMMTKLQNMVYGPVFFLFLWQMTGFEGLVKGIFGTMTAFVGLNLEFFLAHKMNLVLQQLTVNYDYFPFYSLNAYNLWWILARANGMYTLDKYTIFGLVNAKTMGLFIFISGYLLACLVLVKDTVMALVRKNGENVKLPDRETVIYRFWTAMIIVSGVFFLFQTESHDRYAFPIAIYALLWGAHFIYTASTKTARTKILLTAHFAKFVLGYLIFTLIYFYNVHTAMVVNYPFNGFPVLSDFIQPVYTITASYLQLLIFAGFLYVAFKHLPKLMILIPVICFAFLVTVKSLPLWTGKPVPLNTYFPIISQQDFGKKQENMSINSFNGVKAWNPLSVQYAFFDHGIGTHAKSYHQFNINGAYRTFTTNYGIDTEAGSDASATFEIYGDDRQLFKSQVMGRFDMPKFINVDITGVKMLGLVTNDGGDGINNDHTDWLNPILWP